MTPQQLKNAILQQAIQGKLVEQRAEEGTGQELFETIQDEKQKLIEEGKLKKQKALPQITEEEIPFEIPETWKWVRLGESGITQTGNTPSKSHSEYYGTYIPFIGPGDINNSKVDYSKNGLSKKGMEFGRKAKVNSILQVCIGGSIGKSCLVDRDVCFNQQINSIYPIISNSKFIFYILSSPYFKKYLTDNAGGTATPIINRSIWDSILIPLPPLDEQKRIVEKIEELLLLVEKYEKAWTRLEELNKKFPLDMQKAILGQAIQGKLVEQRAEEGTGQELFEAIQEEKQKLIKEGKLKKQKALPEITEDKIPFEIPDTWKWVRLGELLYKLTDGAHSTPKYTEEGIPFISVKDLSSGYLNFDSCKYITEEEHSILFNRCNPEFGDILLTKVGTTGIPVIVDTDKQFSLFVSVALLKFNQLKLSNIFLKYLINSPLVQIQAKENTKGVGNKNWVMRDIANTIIPLPPLAEQKRIVEKIEELLPLCEKLK